MQQLYIITNATHLKIGISVDPTKRIKELSTGSSTKLELVHTLIPKYIKASELEAKLHARFSEYRCNGEWFELTCLPKVLEVLDELDMGTMYSAKVTKSLNATAGELEYLGAMYFNPEQTKELMQLCPNALVLMQHYVAIGKQVNPVMEDDQLASMLTLKPAQVKAIRLALTKAGWFKRIKTTIKGEVHIIYLVGKQAVANHNYAVVA